jgi:hypothetical protein
MRKSFRVMKFNDKSTIEMEIILEGLANDELGNGIQATIVSVQRDTVETPTAYNWVVTCYYEVNA